MSKGAVLHKDGRISQDVTVSVSCTFYGSSACKRWRMQQQQGWRATCHHITDVKLSFISVNPDKLKALEIKFSNNISRETCCRNSSTFLKLFGNNYEFNLLSSDLSQMIQLCKFSEPVEEVCNANSGQLNRSVICYVKGFVITQYSKVSCYTKETVKNICNPVFNCDQ